MNETRVLSEPQEHSLLRDFATMLNALSRPGAYPFALPGDAAISIIQTHASAVLLTPDRVFKLRQGSNELDSSCSRERSSPVMLSAAKHLAADRDRPFASLRVTWCD